MLDTKFQFHLKQPFCMIIRFISKIHLRKQKAEAKEHTSTRYLIISEICRKGESHHQIGGTYNSLAGHGIDLSLVRSFIFLTIELSRYWTNLSLLSSGIRTSNAIHAVALSGWWQSAFFQTWSEFLKWIRSLQYLHPFPSLVNSRRQIVLTRCRVMRAVVADMSASDFCCIF